jgi:hypothetical protein
VALKSPTHESGGKGGAEKLGLVGTRAVAVVISALSAQVALGGAGAGAGMRLTIEDGVPGRTDGQAGCQPHGTSTWLSKRVRAVMMGSP